MPVDDAAGPSAEDWERKAYEELDAARLLLRGRHWQQAFHHAGFAVECALKCRIMRAERLNRWPDRSERRELYSHDLIALARIAGLDRAIQGALEAGDPVGLAWLIAKDWTNETRYDVKPFPEARARDMLEAVDGAGLLSWLMRL